MKKTLAFLLALVMAVPCLVTPAFAATAENVRQYGKEENAAYLAIGDSVGRGIGTTNWIGYDYYATSDTAFCKTVGAATGFTSANMTACNFNASTLSGLMDILGLKQCTDSEREFLRQYNNYDAMVTQYGPSSGTPISEMIKSASLITIEMGMCDVIYEPLRRACVDSGVDFWNLTGLNAETGVSILAKATSYVWNNYARWEEDFPAFLKYVREKNPNATVVVVGSYNILAGVSITDKSLVKTGDVFATLSASMNAHYRQWAKDYNALYADISQVRTLAGEKGWSLTGEEFWVEMNQSTHPSQAGHDQIAAAILKALPEADAQSEPTLPTTPQTIAAGKLFNAISSTYNFTKELVTVPTITDNVTRTTSALKSLSSQTHSWIKNNFIWR